ncbi:MAG: hypothetical protein CMH52_09830 [Myxococcales bacterium]|nr:hypothetical protein [Myxococcales bacterium]
MVSFALSFLLLCGCVVITAAIASGTVEEYGKLPLWHTGLPLCAVGLGAVVHLPLEWIYPWYGVSLLWFASIIGARLGREIQSPSHVWPLVLVACAFDYWSVMTPAGFTQAAVEEPGLLSSINPLILVFPIPLVGPQPILGVGDVVFAGFCMGIVKKLEVDVGRACLGLLAGFLICLVLLLSLQMPLPALLCIGPAFALSYGRALKPKLMEMFGSLAFIIVGLLVLTAVRSG